MRERAPTITFLQSEDLMKNILMRGCAVIVLVVANNTAWATPATDDLIKLARSGVDEEVLSAYIETSSDTFDLSADEIITLKDLGVPSKIISDALRHGHAYESDSASVAAARETIHAASNDTGTASPVVSTASAVAPPPNDQNISFFYEALYPYGSWLQVDGVWCWQPNAAIISEEWAPYCRHGHWVWSDWGWCWDSDYSWGWAPFHYGRWFRHRSHGWCWAPDNEWGPAWVAWRRGDDYCGWAPLPPHTRYVNREGFYFGNRRVGDDFEFNLKAHDYFFMPARNFCDPHPWMNMVPSVRAEDVYRRTDFVRNSYGFEHDHIINRGLPVEEISRASNRPITPITIVNDDLRPGQPIRRGLLREDKFIVYKPALAPVAPRTPAAIRSLWEKKQPSVPQQKNARDGIFIKREKTAAQQTLKTQQVKAENATQERFHLEKAAGYETNAKKRSELQAEAEIQSMKAQQANYHVGNIRQWKPSAEQKPAVMPQSRVVPQPTPENRGQVQSQVRAQIQNEARIEQERQPAMEEMIRNHGWERNNAGSAKKEDRGDGSKGK
jgi:hypothetical protein